MNWPSTEEFWIAYVKALSIHSDQHGKTKAKWNGNVLQMESIRMWRHIWSWFKMNSFLFGVKNDKKTNFKNYGNCLFFASVLLFILIGSNFRSNENQISCNSQACKLSCIRSNYSYFVPNFKKETVVILMIIILWDMRYSLWRVGDGFTKLVIYLTDISFRPFPGAKKSPIFFKKFFIGPLIAIRLEHWTNFRKVQFDSPEDFLSFTN